MPVAATSLCFIRLVAFFEDHSTCHSLLFLPMICIKCNILLLSLAAFMTFLYYLIMQQFQQEKSQLGWGTPVFLTIILLWHTKYGHMSFSQGSCRVVFVCLCACARSYAWSDKNIIKNGFFCYSWKLYTLQNFPFYIRNPVNTNENVYTVITLQRQ